MNGVAFDPQPHGGAGAAHRQQDMGDLAAIVGLFVGDDFDPARAVADLGRVARGDKNQRFSGDGLAKGIFALET